MANDAGEVVVGANGTIWVAPITATAVDDVGTAMTTVDTDWIDLGFVSEDGATFTEGKDITDIGAWQSFYPIRRIVTGRSVQAAFALRQWNTDTVEFAFGGTVSNNGGEFMFTPPSPEMLDERSLTIEWFDGDYTYRIYLPRGIVSEAIETQLVRTAAADLPITFGAMDPGAGLDAYGFFTDDPAFTATSS